MWTFAGLQYKNLSWLFGADRKIRPSGSLFGITRQSLVTINCINLRDIDKRQYGNMRYEKSDMTFLT